MYVSMSTSQKDRPKGLGAVKRNTANTKAQESAACKTKKSSYEVVSTIEYEEVGTLLVIAPQGFNWVLRFTKG